jgi:hypothetical protein
VNVGFVPVNDSATPAFGPKCSEVLLESTYLP